MNRSDFVTFHRRDECRHCRAVFYPRTSGACPYCGSRDVAPEGPTAANEEAAE